MKYSLVALFLFVAPLVHSYNPVEVITSTPFEEIIIQMDSEGQKQSYLGTLETYPHLYEFLIEETITLQVQTRQKLEEDALPVNLILLSVDPDTERISEIVRLNTPVDERNEVSVNELAIEVIESELLEVELEPGLYRLEVSTPLNESPYELNFGTESVDNSYFGMFGTVWEVQHHFGYSWTHFIFSTYVLYQIGIILLASGFYYTWRRRKEISSVS